MIELREELWLICKYDDEPNAEKYNATLSHQIDRLSDKMVISAINTLKKANL